LNTASGFVNQNQIKYSEGYDRANLQFADVNGDGRADYIWIDKFTGDGYVWYNMGPMQISGSSFWWESQGALYEGTSNGPNIHYPDLGGEGRADMLEVVPKTGYGYVWFNDCPGGEDDANMTSPNFPAGIVI
jgi:hypothetical protein